MSWQPEGLAKHDEISFASLVWNVVSSVWVNQKLQPFQE
jgi:hypothetical protein